MLSYSFYLENIGGGRRKQWENLFFHLVLGGPCGSTYLTEIDVYVATKKEEVTTKMTSRWWASKAAWLLRLFNHWYLGAGPERK